MKFFSPIFSKILQNNSYTWKMSLTSILKLQYFSKHIRNIFNGIYIFNLLFSVIKVFLFQNYFNEYKIRLYFKVAWTKYLFFSLKCFVVPKCRMSSQIFLISFLRPLVYPPFQLHQFFGTTRQPLIV